MRGKEKERESFLSSVSWVERKREVKRRRRGSMVSLKRGGRAERVERERQEAKRLRPPRPAPCYPPKDHSHS